MTLRTANMSTVVVSEKQHSSRELEYKEEMRKLKSILDRYDRGEVEADDAYTSASALMAKTQQLVQQMPESSEMLKNPQKILGPDFSEHERARLSKRYAQLETSSSDNAGSFFNFKEYCCASGRASRRCGGNWMHDKNEHPGPLARPRPAPKGELPQQTSRSWFPASWFDPADSKAQEDEFEAAFHAVMEQIDRNAGSTDHLRLHALQMQTQRGDCSEQEKPSVFNRNERLKYNAWNALRGKPLEECRSEYIELARKMGAKW